MPSEATVLGVRRVVLIPALIIVAALSASTVAVLLTTAGAAPLFEISPVIEYGLPAAKSIVNLAAAATIGGLLTASVVLARSSPGWGLVLDIAAVGGLVWTAGAAAATVLTYLNVAGPVRPEVFGPGLGQFLTQIDLGRAWLATLLTGAVLTILCFAVRSHTGVAAVTILAFAALIPLALQGHAAGAGSHTAASSALWLHVAASASWIGGLLALVLVHRKLQGVQAHTALKRYSTIALASFVVLVTAGTIGAAVRLSSPEQLLSTGWGLLLLGKVLILLILGAAGAYYRRGFLTQPASPGSSQRAIWRLVIAELALMGVASGLAAVLSRTPPPVVEQIAVSASERLTGQPLPPMFGLDSAFTVWAPDPIWLLLAGLGVVSYLRAVTHLRRRGGSWPASRTVSWMAAMVLLWYLTNGAPGVYSTYLLSTQLLVFMTFAFVLPLLLILGSPVTLLTISVPKREDGSRGAREWTRVVLESRPVTVLTHPIVAASLLVASLILYSIPASLKWAVTDPVGQQWANLHLLLIGLVFYSSFVGTRTRSQPAAGPLRLLTPLVVIAFLAVYGLMLASGPELLLPEWYGVIIEGWPLDPLSDQQNAGVITFAAVSVPALILGVILGRRWKRRKPTNEPGLLSSAADAGEDVRKADPRKPERVRKSHAPR
ncbi:cytochrome c oxidase assembly protein [Agromyces sp. Marseille-Q5079]|uniref:cytochrome c oxidase assembly protein n=1 Tax=Agromyces sp. Marseille-Q5079 TaxID=3439059 RepID=UPI003D9CA5BC